ncbi:MAG: DUF1415 domain-containing protein [Chromatiaceae bacterium]|nr:DUF1415 domain-containing protein [Chromatiaceae bacterium]
MIGDGDSLAVVKTRHWLERIVIGLNLCPFAAAPYRADRILYAVSDEAALEGIYQAFLATLQDLLSSDPHQQETALLILAGGLASFDDYLDALAVFEGALAEAGLEGLVQLASFHPHYRFEGANDDDPANYTNRSPLPMFHLIREDGLAAALESYPQPELIPERNIRRLRELGLDGIAELLNRP